MWHNYKRTTIRADGTRHVELASLKGDQVAAHLGGHRAGHRLDFLELLNRWNRTGLAATEPDSPIYIFTAESI